MTRVTYPCNIYFSSATLKASKRAKSLKVGRLTNIFLPSCHFDEVMKELQFGNMF